MAIDHSIYFQQQPLDIVGNVQKGMSVRSMLDEQKLKKEELQKQKSIDQAYAQGIVQNPDGTTSIDSNRTLSALAQVPGAGREAFKAKSEFVAQDAATHKANIEKKIHELDLTARLAGGVTDQTSYDNALAQAQQFGVNTSSMPRQYDPAFVRRLEASSLSAKERLDMDLRRQELQSKALDRREARDERRFQSGIKMDEKRQALKTPYGLANSVDDAKKLKDAHEAKMNFDSKLQEMISLRKKYGTEYFNREAVARGKQLSKDLLLEYKNMAKLGVLSKSDEDIINAIIPDDPLGQDFAPGQDPILSNLEKFKADSDRDFQTRVQTRTRANVETATRAGSDQRIDQYAKQYGLDYAQAESILKARGYGAK